MWPELPGPYFPLRLIPELELTAPAPVSGARGQRDSAAPRYFCCSV